MFRRERERWMQLLIDEREAHRRERQELLNRIARPEAIVRDAPDLPPVDQVSVKDLEELAQVGSFVSDTFRHPEEEA